MPLSAPLPVAQKSGTTLTTFMPVTSGGTTAQAYQLAALNSAGQFDPSLVVISGGSGTGTVTSVATTGGITGGPITTMGTISLATIASSTFLANATAGTALPVAVGLGAGVVFSGGVLVNAGVLSLGGASGGITLGPGLTMAGTVLSNTFPGTVTSVATTGGITGGPITTTGTVSLSSLASQSLLGNPTAGAATPISVPIGAGLAFSGGNLVATATGGGVDGLWWYG